MRLRQVKWEITDFYLLEKTENDFRLYSKEKIAKSNAATDWRIDDFSKKLGQDDFQEPGRT